MNIINQNIDGGKAFDWGRTSEDYAKFRDIYPQIFYDNIVNRGIGIAGQTVLDLGTGTGVIPRNRSNRRSGSRQRMAWTLISAHHLPKQRIIRTVCSMS